MTDRLFFAGYARCYPSERTVPLTLLVPAVQRLELALARRADDGVVLRNPGPVEPIPLESMTALNVCRLCGRIARSTRNYCDEHLGFGMASPRVAVAG